MYEVPFAEYQDDLLCRASSICFLARRNGRAVGLPLDSERDTPLESAQGILNRHGVLPRPLAQGEGQRRLCAAALRQEDLLYS